MGDQDDQGCERGTYTFANGNEYVGELEDGVPNESGTETSANGDKYVGEMGLPLFSSGMDFDPYHSFLLLSQSGTKLRQVRHLLRHGIH